MVHIFEYLLFFKKKCIFHFNIKINLQFLNKPPLAGIIMKDEKILYWNSLRNRLNKRIVLFYGIILVLSIWVVKPKVKLISLIEFGISNLIFSVIIELLIYLTFVNFLILIFEFIDRSFRFKKRKKLSWVFEIMINIVFIGFVIYSLFIQKSINSQQFMKTLILSLFLMINCYYYSQKKEVNNDESILLEYAILGIKNLIQHHRKNLNLIKTKTQLNI